MNIEHRIERAETALSIGQEPIIIEVVWFGGGPLPPEEHRGNIITRHVAFESVRGRLKREGSHDD
jgi:hypothetical protein